MIAPYRIFLCSFVIFTCPGLTVLAGEPSTQPVTGKVLVLDNEHTLEGDIERIGDYAANVAKRSIPLSMVAPIAPTSGLSYLAELAAQEVAREALRRQAARVELRSHRPHCVSHGSARARWCACSRSSSRRATPITW